MNCTVAKYHNTSAGHNKFYYIEREDTATQIVVMAYYGKIDKTYQQSEIYRGKSEYAAQAALRKKIDEKLKKGYYSVT